MTPSSLPGPFGGHSDTLDRAHFCPDCGEQCSCLEAEVSAGAEEEEIVRGCTHQCDGYKPDSNHRMAF